MDYPTQATVNDSIVYDADATIVINEAKTYWGEVVPKVLRANEISHTYRQHDAIIQREHKKLENLDKVKEYLIENVDELGDHATEIAKILELDLDSYVDVTLNITATLTMCVPFGKSIEDLSEYDFDVDITCNDDDFEIESSDINVDRLDY